MAKELGSGRSALRRWLIGSAIVVAFASVAFLAVQSVTWVAAESEAVKIRNESSDTVVVREFPASDTATPPQRSTLAPGDEGSFHCDTLRELDVANEDDNVVANSLCDEDYVVFITDHDVERAERTAGTIGGR